MLDCSYKEQRAGYYKPLCRMHTVGGVELFGRIGRAVWVWGLAKSGGASVCNVILMYPFLCRRSSEVITSGDEVGHKAREQIPRETSVLIKSDQRERGLWTAVVLALDAPLQPFFFLLLQSCCDGQLALPH